MISSATLLCMQAHWPITVAASAVWDPALRMTSLLGETFLHYYAAKLGARSECLLERLPKLMQKSEDCLRAYNDRRLRSQGTVSGATERRRVERAGDHLLKIPSVKVRACVSIMVHAEILETDLHRKFCAL